jgi:hypothetical protein
MSHPIEPKADEELAAVLAAGNAARVWKIAGRACDLIQERRAARVATEQRK